MKLNLKRSAMIKPWLFFLDQKTALGNPCTFGLVPKLWIVKQFIKWIVELSYSLLTL